MSSESETQTSTVPQLRREVGLWGAVLLGLGSILGTGVFISMALAIEAVGPSALLAIVVAGAVATLNGLNSAQLAAAYPVSGGTYEYAYRCVGPAWGFAAGWMFLCAKSASAATAALGFSTYLLQLLGLNDPLIRTNVAGITAIAVTALVATGIRRSNLANAVIVSVTLVSLGAFALFAALQIPQAGLTHVTPFVPEQATLPRWFEACALLFVAYTGYGRVATLGEEMRDPQRNVPRAVILTLIVSSLLYLLVAGTGLLAVGPTAFAAAARQQEPPLAVTAALFSPAWATILLSVGAILAMLGVLLNLVLGTSRVALAMGRRGDLPPGVAILNVSQTTPIVAVLLMGAIITGMALLGSIRTTWTFSAFTVLVYYALTNLAAWHLPSDQRMFPRWVAAAGLVGCLGLAFWVPVPIWLTGCGLLAFGFIVRWLLRRSGLGRNLG